MSESRVVHVHGSIPVTMRSASIRIPRPTALTKIKPATVAVIIRHSVERAAETGRRRRRPIGPGFRAEVSGSAALGSPGPGAGAAAALAAPDATA